MAAVTVRIIMEEHLMTGRHMSEVDLSATATAPHHMVCLNGSVVKRQP